MDVTIIGTGNMSRGLATRTVAGGHLPGKTVLDITNPVDFTSFTPVSVEAGFASAIKVLG